MPNLPSNSPVYSRRKSEKMRIVNRLDLIKILSFCLLLFFPKNLWGGFETKTFNIYMISFHKRGEIERGFISYLNSSGLKIRYTFRSCNGNLETCPFSQYVEEVKKTEPDLVVCCSTTITKAIAGTTTTMDPKKHVTRTPIIAMPIGAPVAAGFAPALNTYTGRKLGGVTQMIPTSEQLQVIRGFKKFKKIGIIYTPFEPSILAYVKELKDAASNSGDFEVMALPLPLLRPFKADGNAIPRLFKELVDKGMDLFYHGSDPSMLAFAPILVPQIQKYRVPSFATSEASALAFKPLVSFICKFYHVGQMGGHLAEQILLGLRTPEELYQFQRMRYMSYIIDMKKALELEIYPSINSLILADIDTE